MAGRQMPPESPARRKLSRRNGPLRVRFPHFHPDVVGRGGMNPSAPNPSAPRHIPVLGRQAVELLSPRDGGIYVDATFGAGGDSRGILDIKRTTGIGVDRDRRAS